MDSHGYNPKNMKIEDYSGTKVLSFELSYTGINFLYYIYQLPIGNYSIEFYARNATSTIDYDLIKESISLSNNISKESTFALEEEKGEVETSKINSGMLN